MEEVTNQKLLLGDRSSFEREPRAVVRSRFKTFGPSRNREVTPHPIGLQSENRDVKSSPCDFLLRVLFLIFFFLPLALLVK